MTNAIHTITTDTYALATPLGRLPGTLGHANAVAYIMERFNQIGLNPYSGDNYALPYKTARSHFGIRIKPITMTNIVGVVPGSDRSLPPIVIGAHHDSIISAPSADDNAAAVAAMLHVAQRLVDTPLTRDVVIAAFDGEEPPAFHTESMGSTRFVEDHTEFVHAAIIMDLIGHPAPISGIDPHLTAITGIESHPDFASILDGSALPIIAARNSSVGDMSDHHAFRMYGDPFLFLSSGEWADYHSHRDTPDKIDYTKVAAVAVEVERLARATDLLTLGTAQNWDITELEMSTAVEHLGEGLVGALGGTPSRIVPTMRRMMAAA